MCFSLTLGLGGALTGAKLERCIGSICSCGWLAAMPSSSALVVWFRKRTAADSESRLGRSIVSLVSVALLVGAGRAGACTCIGDPGPRRELRRSAVVFSGSAVSTAPIGPSIELTTFWVVESWKGLGRDTSTLKVRSRSGEGCGFRFRQGESYLVYAYEYKPGTGTLDASVCSRTRPLADAAADLKKLGKPRWRLRRAQPKLIGAKEKPGVRRRRA